MDKVPGQPAGANVPPPSTEVLVRTLAGDLARMKQSGGIPGEGESVSVRVGTSPVPAKAVAPPTTPPPTTPSLSRFSRGSRVPQIVSSATPSSGQFGGSAEKKTGTSFPAPPKIAAGTRTPRMILFVVGGVVLAILLIWGGYAISPLFFGGEERPPSLGNGSTGGELPPPDDTPPPPPAHTELPFLSFFRDAPSERILLSGLSLGNFMSSLEDAIVEYEGTPFLEIRVVHEEGGVLSWEEFTSRRGAQVDKDFFSRNFLANFTLFTYKDDKGLHPGYILRLKEGKHPLELISGLARFEAQSGAIAALSGKDPSNARPRSFEDAQITGQPVRVSKNADGIFLYGWFHNSFLVLSTSEDGMKEAVRRL